MLENIYRKQNRLPLCIAIVLLGVILGFSHLLGMTIAILLSVVMVGVVVFILAKQKYHYGVILTVFLLSCVLIEPSPSDILFCALLVVGIVVGKLKLDGIQKIIPILIIFTAYQAYCVLTLTTATELFAALRYYLITLYLFLFTVFIAVYTQECNIVSIQRAYIVSALFTFIAGLLGYLGILSHIFMADAYRVKGLFKDPNVFGPFFVPAVLMLIDDCRRRRIIKGRRWIHFFLITCFTLATLFSFSRAAWICWLVTTFLYGVFNIRTIMGSKLFRRIIVAGIFVILILIVLWNIGLSDTQVGQFIISRATIKSYDAERFSAQRSGLTLFIDNPWGCGPGQYENEVMRIMKISMSAHSLYFRVLAENGIIGFILFFLGIGYLMVQLYMQHVRMVAIRSDRDGGISPSVLLSIICGYLVVSLVIDTLHWRHLWLFVGLGLYSIKQMEG